MALIKELEKLTPAEAYFLMFRNTLSREMMKLTLGDLIVRKSLEIKYITMNPSPQDKVVMTYKFVKRSSNFFDEHHNDAEKHLLKFFTKPDSKFQLKSFAKMVAKDLLTQRKSFKDDFVKKSKNLAPFVDTNFFI